MVNQGSYVAGRRSEPSVGPRAIALTVARSIALAGPTALAFFSGGYFDEARGWAGAGAWLAVGLAALAGARLPRGLPTRLAVGGLAGFAAWTLLSILWAPEAGLAYHAGQIVALYLGAVVAAAMVFRGPALSWLEPGLAAGATIVIGYGLSARLLPGVLTFARSVSALGRLEQPLTYWNAMGELAALGFVLCARLSGDARRPAAVRAAAAAAAAPLGLGLYISFSRGALFAALAGLVALVALAPQRAQVGAIARTLLTGILATLAGAFFKGVSGLSGALAARESQGLIALVLLAAIMVAAALVQWRAPRREQPGELSLPARAPWLATGVIVAGLAVAIVVGAHESSLRPETLASGASRLVSLQSNRYDYWAVAIRAFGSSPLHGVGAGGWSVDWLRWRHVSEVAQDAHSLPLQTLAELGLVGLALLLVFVSGPVLAALRSLPARRLAAGPAAALVAYFAHSFLDWDWQMPALTLVAMVLCGGLLAAAEPD